MWAGLSPPARNMRLVIPVVTAPQAVHLGVDPGPAPGGGAGHGGGCSPRGQEVAGAQGQAAQKRRGEQQEATQGQAGRGGRERGARGFRRCYGGRDPEHRLLEAGGQRVGNQSAPPGRPEERRNQRDEEEKERLPVTEDAETAQLLWRSGVTPREGSIQREREVKERQALTNLACI